jgi:hypothetical protein
MPEHTHCKQPDRQITVGLLQEGLDLVKRLDSLFLYGDPGAAEYDQQCERLKADMRKWRTQRAKEISDA